MPSPSKRSAGVSFSDFGEKAAAKKPRSIQNKEKVAAHKPPRIKEEKKSRTKKPRRIKKEARISKTSKSKRITRKIKQEPYDPNRLYEVDCFLRHEDPHMVGDKYVPLRILVKWKGWEEHESTLEPVKNLMRDVPHLVLDYAKEHDLFTHPLWNKILTGTNVCASVTSNDSSLNKMEEDCAMPNAVPSFTISATVTSVSSAVKSEDRPAVSEDENSATTVIPAAVKQEEAKARLRKAKETVMEKHSDRLLFRRLQGISKALGGNFVPSFPKIGSLEKILNSTNFPIPKSLQDVDIQKNSDDPEILEHLRFVAFNGLYQLNGPKFAGQPTAAVDGLPEFFMEDREDQIAFPLFMKRTKTSKKAKNEGKIIGWEYVGNYKYVGDKDVVVWESAHNLTRAAKNKIAKDILESSKAIGESWGKRRINKWRSILEDALQNDPSPAAPLYMVEGRAPTAAEKTAPVPSLAARARALGMRNGEHISDFNLVHLMLQLDEYHQQYPIEFVEYDERIYNFCSSQKDGTYKKVTANTWYEYAMAQMLL